MRFLLAAALLALVTPALAQTPDLWSDVDEGALRGGAERVTVPTAYRVVRLDRTAMESRLAAAPAEARPGDASRGTAVAVPLPEGGVVEVRVVEASVMAPELQAQFPEIRTYLAQGDGSVHGRLSLTPAGFRGMLFTPEGAVYVDPYARGDVENYVVYRAADLQVDPALRGRVADEVEAEGAGEASGPRADGPARANGATLRTYRLAMAATGEYTAYHGGTVALGLAAIVATVNRVGGIYERELSVRFTLVANNNLIVYTNAATDPYANTSGDLTANQNNITAVIGSANYDIGHLVGTGGGGVAGLGVVCNTANKARGLTGSPAPVGDAFDVDYVAHEVGHQFRGNHTFNSTVCSGNRNGSTAVEPGSGTTIMAYAGICGSDDLQPNSDPFFHAVSLDEITAFITNATTGGSCGATAATGNTIPTVTPPAAVTIPISTPFALTGSATDDTPASLTYLWEEMDAGASASAPGTATPPLFRSFSAVTTPTRYFPQLPRLLANQAPVIGERLPTLGRGYTFRLTARDNRAGGGAINDAQVVVTAVAAAGPFIVTSQGTAGQTATGAISVTWDVANTNVAPVSTSAVDILFSNNNGASFDYVLAAATPNDGSQTVVLPNRAAAQGRIMVRAVGNVFFNVNAQPFAVTAAAPPQVTGGAGWRLLAAPTAGVTVANLAALNLVQGVPGYYPPPQAQPNLYTDYDGTAYAAPAGGSTMLTRGRGFYWYFYNVNLAPGGASNSSTLPTALTTTAPPVTADATVALHASGSRFNLLGNPFDVGLNVSSVSTWPGASNLASTVVQMWNATGGTYESSLTRPTISSWQGFFAEGATAGTLTIPTSARAVGGTLVRPTGTEAPEALLAFELSDARGDRVDRAAVLALGEGRLDAHDAGDATKLAPVDAAHVLLAFATGDDGALRAVESRPLVAATLPIAVASVGAGADLVLTWPRVEGVPADWALVLRDLETGQTADLGAVDHYAFSVAPTEARAEGSIPGARATALAPRFELSVGPRGVVSSEGGTPDVLALDAPRPNPAAADAVVGYALAEGGPVRLTVVDLLGREVAVLADAEQAAGRHTASLAASRLAPGIYVVRLAAGGWALTRRLVVVR